MKNILKYKSLLIIFLFIGIAAYVNISVGTNKVKAELTLEEMATKAQEKRSESDRLASEAHDLTCEVIGIRFSKCQSDPEQCRIALEDSIPFYEGYYERSFKDGCLTKAELSFAELPPTS